MELLTPLGTKAILKSLSVGKLSGLRTPVELGQKMTAPFAVFFRLSFRPVLIPVQVLIGLSSLAGLFGQLNGWPRLVAVVRTHSNPPPKSFEPLSVGLSTLTRIHRMSTITPSRAKSAQHTPVTPLFSLFAYHRLIASNISGSLALRFKSRYPAAVVKFSGFEVGAA